MRYVDETGLSVRKDFVGLHDINGTTAVELYDLLINSFNNLGFVCKTVELSLTMELQKFLVTIRIVDISSESLSESSLFSLRWS